MLCDRSTKWGNPFSHRPIRGTIHVATLRDSLIEYEAYVRTNESMMDELRELRGQRLGCHCTVASRCHCGVLARLTNERFCD